MPTSPEPTPYNLAARHAEQLAAALEQLIKRRTPDHVSHARYVLSSYYGSSVNPLAKLTPKERQEWPTLQLSGPDWVEIFYALESKALGIQAGHYGPELRRGEDRRWVKHLRDIMGKIGGSGIRI